MNTTVSTSQKTDAFPKPTVKSLFQFGVHFGHRVSATNPRAKRFIATQSNGVSIIDVRKSAFYLSRALDVMHEYAKQGKRVLFVTTNEKYFDQVKDLAQKCAQYYICNWKGGILTNWRTMVSSIKTLKKYNAFAESIEKNGEADVKYTKKEVAKMMLQREKLNRSFGGIINMSGMPDLVVVFSVKAERLAIEEAKCVGIPVIGIVDTNANPDDITFPIPGNDDSLLSFSLYSDLFSGAILSGTKEWSLKAGAKKAEKAANGEKGEKGDKSEKGDKREKGKFDRKSGDKKRFGDKNEKGEKSDKPKHFAAKIEKKTRLADKKPEAPVAEAAAEVAEATPAPAPETTAAE